MKTRVNAEGQITIPPEILEKFHLNSGDEIEFDEDAPILTARRVVGRERWNEVIAKWRGAARESLSGHPWEKATAASIVDDLRGGPAEPESVPAR